MTLWEREVTGGCPVAAASWCSSGWDSLIKFTVIHVLWKDKRVLLFPTSTESSSRQFQRKGNRSPFNRIKCIHRLPAHTKEENINFYKENTSVIGQKSSFGIKLPYISKGLWIFKALVYQWSHLIPKTAPCCGRARVFVWEVRSMSTGSGNLHNVTQQWELEPGSAPRLLTWNQCPFNIVSWFLSSNQWRSFWPWVVVWAQSFLPLQLLSDLFIVSSAI